MERPRRSNTLEIQAMTDLTTFASYFFAALGFLAVLTCAIAHVVNWHDEMDDKRRDALHRGPKVYPAD